MPKATGRKKPFSSVQYSLKELRKGGGIAGVVEKWNPHARVRQDLFGFIDLVAVVDRPTDRHPWSNPVLLGVQSCRTDDMAAHGRKILESPLLSGRLSKWLNTSALFEIWGWAMRGARGRLKKYTLRRVHAVLRPGGELYFEEEEPDNEDD